MLTVSYKFIKIVCTFAFFSIIVTLFIFLPLNFDASKVEIKNKYYNLSNNRF